MGRSNGGPPADSAYWAVYLAASIRHALDDWDTGQQVLEAALAEFRASSVCSFSLRKRLRGRK